MERLITLVHISDLHIGTLDPITADAETERFWAKLKWFEGFLGHSALAMQRLESCFDTLRREEEARLVTTGDLTAFGSRDQFQVATDFLGGSAKMGCRGRIGLHVADWKRYAIPGNHDHWPGKPRLRGASTAAFARVFNFIPYSNRTLNLGGGQCLRFIGIDTDADVRPKSRQRILAQGVFANSLEQLRAEVPDPDRNEIRVLLMHHSYLAPKNRLKALQIVEHSRSALNDFLIEKDIAIVLTGHIHDPLVDRFTATAKSQALNVIEARCGTTTQITSLPDDMTTLLGRPPRWPNRENSLLVHRIYRDADKTIHWAIEGWHLTRFKFEPGPVHPSPVAIQESYPVWPR